jgi:flavodoxin I
VHSEKGISIMPKPIQTKTLLIAYASVSGNTEEVAELIAKELTHMENDVTLYCVSGSEPFPYVPDYDAMLIGTYTWGSGDTPFDVKDFVADIGYKPEHVFVFGTGDTQFGGEDMFCMAADKLAKFYHSPLAPLKIEQSPRGSQEQEVVKWTRGVIEWLN